MGARGPVPKRSEQRRRVNKPETPIVSVPAARVVTVPEADAGWHPIASALFTALSRSGQSAFYEPSDWAKAQLAAELTSRALGQSRPPAQLFSVIDSMWSSLLATEGDRRRLRIELERSAAVDVDDEAAVAAIDDYRARLSG